MGKVDSSDLEMLVSLITLSSNKLYFYENRLNCTFNRLK